MRMESTEGCDTCCSVQVRSYWAGVMDELHSVVGGGAATPAVAAGFSLRDQYGPLIVSTVSYFDAARGMLAAAARNGHNGHNGHNGEGDVVHVGAEESGMSTPAEMEVRN